MDLSFVWGFICFCLAPGCYVFLWQPLTWLVWFVWGCFEELLVWRFQLFLKHLEGVSWGFKMFYEDLERRAVCSAV